MSLGCEILLHVVLYCLAMDAQVPRYCTDGTRLLILADDVFSFDHTNSTFACVNMTKTTKTLDDKKKQKKWVAKAINGYRFLYG